MDRRLRWIAAATAAVVLVACALAWWLLGTDPDRAPAPTADGRPAASATTAPSAEPVRDPCARGATRPFTPHRITIDDIVERAEVVGVPRDDRGVTGVLPASNTVDFAWDLGGIRPGSRRGNVLLNTHTWPDGGAVGNAMLDGLREGGGLVLHGSQGVRLCYRVSQRVEVAVADGYPAYYDARGPHQVAIIVCSGTRSSAGEWSHRTIWFARPVVGG